MVQMKSIRKRRNGYVLLFAASICLAVWLGATFMLEAVFAFGAICLISLLLLLRQSRLLCDATLIWDNRILAVPSALISMPELFKPSDDPESDEPELTVGFKLSAPVTEVTIGGGLSIDEVVGSYHVALIGTDTEGTWLLESMYRRIWRSNSQLNKFLGGFAKNETKIIVPYSDCRNVVIGYGRAYGLLVWRRLGFRQGITQIGKDNRQRETGRR